MTSLAAITFTLVGGIGFFTTTLAFFGNALKNQSPIVASRCAARPPTVIYNPNPEHPCQQRGNNPMFGWILWVMRLSYDTLLQGVPGTGTRKGGLEGTLLKVNLDGIVLLRFHHLCLRIAGVAVVLYLCVMLPLYATAACGNVGEGDTRDGFFSRDVTNREAYCLKSTGADQLSNLTDYQRLTLANIPVLHHESLVNNVTWGSWIFSFFRPDHHGLLARLYTAVFCSWIVTWYTMRQLTQEWQEVLAMRRVYYLEADLWKERQEEMERIGMDREDDYYYRRATAKSKDQHPQSPKKKKGNLQLQRALYRPTNLVVGMSRQIMTTIKQQTPIFAESKTKSEESRTKRRDPWVPHPEQGDTVPNIGLYSILVGGLPVLPTEVRDSEEAVFSRKQSIDWQLSVATAFFDHCVPNQPGFSSSVAAVTVLPQSSHLTEAWGKWFVAAAKLRRLRFIRQQIADLEDEQLGRTEKKRQNYFARRREKTKQNDKDKHGFNDSIGVMREQGQQEMERRKSVEEEKNENNRSQMKRSRSIYHSKNKNEMKQYNRNLILGSNTDLDVDANLLNALDFGPEQSAVYSREFALSSAALAPNGWCAERIRFATMDELIVMEQSAVEAVHDANEELRAAQEAILDDDDDFESSLDDENMEQLMGKTSSHGRLSSDQGRLGREYSNGSDGDADSFAQASPLGGVELDKIEIDFGDGMTRERSKLLRNGESSQILSNEEENVLVSTAKALHKQISVGTKQLANLTGATTFGQNLANMTNLTNLNLGGGGGGGRQNIVRRSDVTTAQLPDHLGLEAGLWMRSRKSTTGRNSTISRSGSSESLIERAKMGRSVSDGSASRYRRQSSAESDRRSVVSSTGSTTSSGTFWDQLEQNTHEVLKHRDPSGLNDIIDEESGSVYSNGEKSASGSPSNSFKDEELTALSFSDEEVYEQDSPKFSDICNRIDEQRTRLKNFGSQNPSDIGNASDRRPKSHKSILSSSDRSIGISEVFRYDDSKVHGDHTGPRLRAVAKKVDKWSKVEGIVRESSDDKKKKAGVTAVEVSDGTWKVKTWQESFFLIIRQLFEVLTCVTSNTTEVVEHFDDLARDSTYAVVTFTSRQAAVAARHCLADSRGGGRWVTYNDIPVPPLADSPPMNSGSFRGFLKPVTFTINDKQKLIRSQVANACTFMLYFFYTIPLVAAQQLVEPEQLRYIFPDIDSWQERSDFVRTIFSGMIPALVWTGFFALCPIIFKMIANFGSNATSLVEAENSALRSFWWFMVLAAFSGTSLSTAIINGFSRGIRIGAEVQQVIEVTAQSIPSEVSATWLNWVIVRFTLVLPTQYLLQMNSFLFSMVGMECCNRATRGGGAGGPIPYRVYVDSGVVMLCLFALAPASPLIAPAALIYFLICIPLFRWSMIFQYKPKFDIGGERFPFLFDMCISGMVVGQILLTAMMSLKAAAGPALLAGFPLIPTIVFRLSTRKKYLRAFSDAALLQTSLLDGWDTNEGTSQQKREEFRQFLVDSHKAAYVPVCIAGDNSAPITTEPAVVVPLENDEDIDASFDAHVGHGDFGSVRLDGSVAPPPVSNRGAPQFVSPHTQPGPMMRRAQNLSGTARKPGSSRDQNEHFGNTRDDRDDVSFTIPLASSLRSFAQMPPDSMGSPGKQDQTPSSFLMSPTRKNAQRFVRAKLPDSPAL